MTPSGVVETLVESAAKSQSDKRFATSWKNLVVDIEKAAKLANQHGSKPSNLSDEEWAMVLSHRTRPSKTGSVKAKTSTTRRAVAKKAAPKKAVAKKTTAKKATTTKVKVTRKAAAKPAARKTKGRIACEGQAFCGIGCQADGESSQQVGFWHGFLHEWSRQRDGNARLSQFSSAALAALA